MKYSSISQMCAELKAFRNVILDNANKTVQELCPGSKQAQSILQGINEVADSKFHFEARKERFLYFSNRTRFFKEMNLVLSDLVHEFDSAIIMPRREAQASQLGIVMPNAEHLCFIAPYKSDKTGIFSEMYFDYLPPDKRLIYIGLDKSIWRSPMVVLHEVGHFIGIRQRPEVRMRCFLELISHTLSFLILNEYRANISHQQKTEEEKLSEEVAIITYIRDSFKSNLYRRLEQAIKAHRDDKRASLHSRGVGYDDLSLFEKNDVASILGYFRFIRPIIIHSLIEILDNSLQHLKEEHNLSELSTFGALEEAIRAKYNELDENWRRGTIPDWYQTREEQLEETIADIFMMKISGASVSDFIESIIYQYQIKTGARSISLTNGSLMPRIIAVCKAMDATEKDFSRKYDRFMKYLPYDLPIVCRYQTRMNIRKCYVEFLSTSDVSDTYKLITRYAKSIWKSGLKSGNDETDLSYDGFISSHKELIDQIRKMLCRPRPLLNLLYKRMPVSTSEQLVQKV